jgi:class 3 adenylate cyclase
MRSERRLAAILAADIAGYSALMGADEERTVHDLKGHQAVLLPMIARAGGRVIDTAGDGILAEFPSVLGAVECATAIQETMAERNAVVDPTRRMEFRIAINQGDVVFDESRIYAVLRHQPNASRARTRLSRFRHEWMYELSLDGLRKAGLPEG